MNKIILIGNVGRDPEIKALASGKKCATFSLATTKRWKSNGEQQERTEWHNIVAWEKLADTLAMFVSKGTKIAIEGELIYRQWDDKDGNKRTTAEIVAQNFEFVESKKKQDDVTPQVPEEDDLPF